MTILVTGGAGYIGSHVVYALIERGESVVVLDDLSTGRRRLVHPSAAFVQGDTGDRTQVAALLREHSVCEVLHFAGSVSVPESVQDPLRYYKNNASCSLELIAACEDAGVNRFIFSSTAAVYGTPQHLPVSESDPTVPTTPYGRSKLMTEWILQDFSKDTKFRYIALRYFNVAGADPRGRIGQCNDAATHLIKRACAVAVGRQERLQIFGTDYPTPDGTGVRDYIHVYDLALAHLCALDALRSGSRCAVYNVGYGRGFSVREIVAAVEKVVGNTIPTEEVHRRPGDAAAIVADPARIKEELCWQPEVDDLQQIVATALRWEQRRSHDS